MTTVDEALLEKLNTLVVVINSDGKIERANQSVKSMLGYDPEFLSGRQWWIFAGDSRKEKRESLHYVNSLLKSQPEISSFTFERKIISENGTAKWIQWNLSRNGINSLIGLGYDITKRKDTEEKLKLSNKLLQEKNEEITDSIEYAQRLQQAFLPDLNRLKNVLADAFVFYQPKDILSGDFYWYHIAENLITVLAIDCTGHGVPGALMSVLAHSIAKEVVLNKKITSPADILHAIDFELHQSLNNNEKNEITKDGMDVSVIVIDKNKNQLTYAGAFHPMLMIRNGSVQEFSGSRYPIGFYQNIDKQFEEQVVSIEPNDQFYLYSDGYSDQFGGEEGKKLNKRRFIELLLTASGMNMKEQSAFLAYAHTNWKQQEEQTDDLLVLGLKI